MAEDPAADGIAGWYQLRLPDRENLDRAVLNLFVHPASRRGGLGRALLGHAAMRAADHGRSVLRGEVLQGTAGAAFAARGGHRPAWWTPGGCSRWARSARPHRGAP